MTNNDIPTYGVYYPDGARFFTIGGSGLLYTMPGNTTEVLKVLLHSLYNS